MKLLVYIILALVFSAFIVNYVSTYNDYILFTLGDWVIQLSLILFIILLVVTFALLYFCIRTLFFFLEIPVNYKQKIKQRRAILSEKFLTKGLYALTEGKWKQAEKLLMKGAKYSSVPVINYLGAAKAAQNQGKTTKRNNYLQQACLDSSGAKAAIELTRTKLQQEQNHPEQSIATLSHLREVMPDNLQVRLMLLESYQKQGNLSDAIDIAKEIEQQKLMPMDEIKSIQLTLYTGMLRQKTNSQIEALGNRWQDIPDKLKKDPLLIQVYVEEKIKFNDTKDCEILLRRALKKEFLHALVRLYGLVQGDDDRQQLEFAERLLKHHSHDPVLLLTLGRLCVRNNLWGKAKAYLEESIEICPTPEAFRELGLLLEAQGEFSLAIISFQKGLNLATQHQAMTTGYDALSNNQQLLFEDNRKSGL